MNEQDILSRVEQLVKVEVKKRKNNPKDVVFIFLNSTASRLLELKRSNDNKASWKKIFISIEDFKKENMNSLNDNDKQVIQALSTFSYIASDQ